MFKKKRSGVYYIQCKKNGRGYVGASVDMDRRIKDHFYQMRLGWRGLMSEDYKKYGRRGFSVEMVAFVDKCELASSERYWSERLNTEYNVEPPKNNRHWN